MKTNYFKILSAEEINTETDNIIQYVTQVLDEVANTEESVRTFDNTVRKLALCEGHFTTQVKSCDFPAQVSTDKAIRDASVKSDKKLSQFQIDWHMRADVYNVLIKFRDSNPSVAGLDKRLLDKMIQDFERNGLSLSKSEQQIVKNNKKQISELSIEYQKNLNEDETQLLFTKNELSGLSDTFINELSQENNKYIITLKYPHVFPVLNNATNEQTRKTVALAFERKCQEKNIPILAQILKLRHENAKIMKYKTHADYVLEQRMAKNSENVNTFTNKLLEKLLPFGQKEKQVLLDLKQGDTLELWDTRFYKNTLLKTKYNVDSELIKEYFPLDFVTEQMLNIYSELLSVTFAQVPEKDSVVWHDDVQQYYVTDTDTGDFLGQFYLDLYPRDGKFTHAAAYKLQLCYLTENGEMQRPVSAMLANFPKPTHDKPSLLRHVDVITYFHEFGHVMHSMCSQVIYAKFACTKVERDFVEAPSQMLENWCWEFDTLKRMSKHYQTGKEIPYDMVSSMVKAKNVCIGLHYLRQLKFAIFDQRIHTKHVDNLIELWGTLQKEIELVESIKDASRAGSFMHLVAGYDSQYYGYLYSEVFSACMFQKFKTQGICNPKLGKKYRDVILSRGGTVDSMDSLIEFLGEEPNQDAFLISHGLK